MAPGSVFASGSVVAGRYVVVRALGQGATKHVYLAEDRLAGGQIALSVLHAVGAHVDPTLGARFSREARAASVLRSAFTVHVFDVGKLADGTRYAASEAVLGRGLDQALARGPIAPDLAARFACQILLALDEAHTIGIVHRDVKPENVMLESCPDGERARLTDFGLAKVLDQGLEGSQNLRTAQNVAIGTPEYMPPEQWQGARIDGRTDVYAVGVTLYEMLSGRLPFAANTLHALCVAHMTERPAALPKGLGALACALEPIVARALAKRPADRFPDARTMEQAIESVTGMRVDDVGTQVATGSTRPARIELTCDAWPGVVCLIASPEIVFGRDPTADIVVRCAPRTEEALAVERTVSLHHARLSWRGGRATLVDLGSRTGTRLGSQSIGSSAVALDDDSEFALGPLLRWRFRHAPAPPGELPRWACVTRLDSFGAAQTHVVVLREAKVSAGADAAVRLDKTDAAGDLLMFRVVDGIIAALPLGGSEPVPLQDGQKLRLGRLVISVAIEAARAQAQQV